MPRRDTAARTAATLAPAVLLATSPARARAPEAAPMDTAPAGPAANSTTLVITGRVARPSPLDIDALRAMPSATVALDAAPGHGATDTGVLAWTLLDAAGLLDAPGRKTFLQHTVPARGQNGSAVGLAIGELDPRFEGRQALVA